MPVLYPARRSAVAMLTCVSGSSPWGLAGVGITRYRSTLPTHPVRIGYLPVCSAARLGVQIAAAEIHCVNFIPELINAEIWGVLTLGAPNAGKSLYPMSSTSRIRTFGRPLPLLLLLLLLAGIARSRSVSSSLAEQSLRAWEA